MLALVLFKYLPQRDQQHQDQENAQRAEFLASDEKKTDNFLEALDKRDELIREELRQERMAREVSTKESTETGKQTAFAMLELSKSIDGLRSDVNTNTDVLRGLTKHARHITGTGYKSREVIAAAEAAKKG